MFRDNDGTILNSMPEHIKDILTDCKYLGVATNTQLDPSEGTQKLIQKLTQRIAITSKNTDNIQEARFINNMIVCQVATFLPIVQDEVYANRCQA
jgi:hypothetical protein